LNIPPPGPIPGIGVPKATEFPEKVQLVIVGEASLQYIPPPADVDVLPLMMQFVIVGEFWLI
jgi:hypothetical protein